MIIVPEMNYLMELDPVHQLEERNMEALLEMIFWANHEQLHDEPVWPVYEEAKGG